MRLFISAVVLLFCLLLNVSSSDAYQRPLPSWVTCSLLLNAQTASICQSWCDAEVAANRGVVASRCFLAAGGVMWSGGSYDTRGCGVELTKTTRMGSKYTVWSYSKQISCGNGGSHRGGVRAELTDSSSGSSSHIQPAVIAVIVVACLVAVALVAVLVFVLMRRRASAAQPEAYVQM